MTIKVFFDAESIGDVPDSMHKQNVLIMQKDKVIYLDDDDFIYLYDALTKIKQIFDSGEIIGREFHDKQSAIRDIRKELQILEGESNV